MKGDGIIQGRGPEGGAASCACFLTPLADEMVFSSAQLEHLSSCAACRLRVTETDPTRLFSLLALERKEDAFWTGFEARVMARVRESDREGSLLLRLIRPRALLLSAGAAVIAMAVLLVTETGERVSRPLSSSGTDLVTGILRGAQEAGAVPGPGSPGVARPDSGVALGASVLLEHSAAAPAPVESIASATAQIISIKVGEKNQDEADVVLIVDQGMDI